MNRDHYYCAYRAYFEGRFENPVAVTGEYLKEIDQVKTLFRDKVLELNRRSQGLLTKVSDREIAALFEKEFGALGLLGDKIDIISPETLKRRGRPVLPMGDRFADMPGREQIPEILEAGDRTVVDVVKGAYDKIESWLDGFDPEMVDPNWIEVLEWLHDEVKT